MYYTNESSFMSSQVANMDQTTQILPADCSCRVSKLNWGFETNYSACGTVSSLNITSDSCGQREILHLFLLMFAGSHLLFSSLLPSVRWCVILRTIRASTEKITHWLGQVWVTPRAPVILALTAG